MTEYGASTQNANATMNLNGKRNYTGQHSTDNNAIQKRKRI